MVVRDYGIISAYESSFSLPSLVFQALLERTDNDYHGTQSGNKGTINSTPQLLSTRFLGFWTRNLYCRFHKRSHTPAKTIRKNHNNCPNNSSSVEARAVAVHLPTCRMYRANVLGGALDDPVLQPGTVLPISSHISSFVEQAINEPERTNLMFPPGKT